MNRNNKFLEKSAPTINIFIMMRLLTFLLALLIGILPFYSQFSLIALGLTVAVASIFLWLLRYVHIPFLYIEKLCCHLTFITGFFGVALFPIELGAFTLYPFRIFLLLLYVFFVIRLLMQGGVLFPQNGIKQYIGFFAIWVIYATTSLSWAASKYAAFRQLIFLFMGVSLIFFVAYYFRDLYDFNLLYWLWFCAFCIMIILGFWEHLTGNHLPVSGYYGEIRERLMYRPTGVFRNPNDYATFLSLSIPFALCLPRYNKNRLLRLLGIGVVLTAFYLIIITGSRANILAVLLALVFLILFLAKLKQKVRIVFLVLLTLAIILFAFPSFIQDFFSKIFTELGSIFVQAKLEYGSVFVRMNIIRNALEFLYSTAGFGVGAGNAEYWMANYSRYDTLGILNPHNWWLEILINYGIFIFIGYIAVYIGIIWTLWGLWHNFGSGKERMIAEALLLAFISFSVASISSSSIMAFHPQWMLFSFALAFLSNKHILFEGKRG